MRISGRAGRVRRPVLDLLVAGLVLSALGGCAGAKLKPDPVLTDKDSGKPVKPDELVIEHPTAEAPDGTVMPVLHKIVKDTGVVIEDLRVGDGPDCLPNSVVVVRYHGTLEDGTIFDTTRGKEPAEFPLDRLIRGWREGLPGMKVGGIRRLTIPANMAYGDKQKGQIPPNSDLTFSIELVSVKGHDAQP